MNMRVASSQRVDPIARALFVALFAAAGFAGCTDDFVPIGEFAAMSCGANTCAIDEVCCNESCGICASEGEACIALECGETTVCGTETCDGALSCCTDCDGEAYACPDAFGACPALDCGGNGPTCSDGRSCKSGEICCPGCGGASTFCASAELGCPALDCAPTGPTCSDGSSCAPDEACCEECDHIVCTDAGACPGDCTDILADSAPPVRECGGAARLRCPNDMYCAYPTSACGEGLGLGVCVARPGGCDADVSPVCGCDGRTYSNACVASAAGVDRFADGPCDGEFSPPDAGQEIGGCAEPCGEGDRCAPCRPGEYLCLPDDGTRCVAAGGA